jgi:hypothetical protein
MYGIESDKYHQRTIKKILKILKMKEKRANEHEKKSTEKQQQMNEIQRIE